MVRFFLVAFQILVMEIFMFLYSCLNIARIDIIVLMIKKGGSKNHGGEQTKSSKAEYKNRNC